MKKLLLNSLLMLTSFAAYAAEETKDDIDAEQTAKLMKTLPTILQNYIIQFLPENSLKELVKHKLIYNKPHLDKTLTGHTSLISSIAYSPDEKLVASCSWDNSIKIWDLETGNCLQTLAEHTNKISQVVFNSTGTQLASSSWDNNIKIWDTRTWQCLHTLIGHESFVVDVAFNPDETQLASSAEDGTIKIWNPQTGYLIHTIPQHNISAANIAWTPEGMYLACKAYNNQIELWNMINNIPYPEHILSDHTTSSTIRSIAISPDGELLASGTEDGTVKVWNLASKECLYKYKADNYFTRQLVFSPDEKKLASLSKHIMIWDLTARKPLHRFDKQRDAGCIAYNKSGSKFTSGSSSNNGTIKIWNCDIQDFKLSTQQNALLYKITQTVLDLKSKGARKKLSLIQPRDQKIYETFPENLKEILKPIVVYEKTTDENEPTYGSASSGMYQSPSKKFKTHHPGL